MVTNMTLWNWRNGRTAPKVKDLKEVKKIINEKDFRFFCDLGIKKRRDEIKEIQELKNDNK